MKLVFSSLLIALATSTVSTAAPPAAAPVAAAVPSADRLELARRYIALGDSNDFMEEIRAVMMRQASASTEDPEDKATAERFLERVFVLAEPKFRARMPAILETAAQAYAREFSADELKDMIAFAQTPTGKHYLARGAQVETDPAIIDARMKVWEDLGPIMEQVGKEFCAEKAAKRIAAGDKKATCPLAKASETRSG